MTKDDKKGNGQGPKTAMRHHIDRLDWLRLHPVKRGQAPNKVSNECESYASHRFGMTAQMICFRLAAQSWARYLITHASEVQAMIHISDQRHPVC